MNPTPLLPPVKVASKVNERLPPVPFVSLKVATVAHFGPYGQLGKAWAEFNEWVASSGHKAGEDLWERYLLSAPGRVKTELTRPLL